MTKMTYATALDFVLSGNYDLPTEVADKLTALKASVEKKNSSEKKPSAQQTANKAIQDAIFDAMETDRLYTITEMIKEFPACAEMTNQRVSALVRQMVQANRVERIEDKRKTYFRVVR